MTSLVAPGADVVYYAQPYGPRLGSEGNRTKIGPEHRAPSFADARRHLDRLGKFGLVYRWTEQTRERRLIAHRADDGGWWQLAGDRRWLVLPPGDIPAYPARPEPAPAGSVKAVPADIAALAASLGHTVIPAPQPLSLNDRWRCQCGAVVLRAGEAGQPFGTALRELCPYPDLAQPSPAS